VSKDIELDAWREDWHSHTEVLPDLKKKIARQNRRMVGTFFVLCLCLGSVTTEAVRTRSSFVCGVAVGLWFASIAVGGYTYWVRRGAWRPAAQTTRAYLELSYKRATAKKRTIRFAFFFLLVTIVPYGIFCVSHWKATARLAVPTLAGMALELALLKHLERRKASEVAETKRLLDTTTNPEA
jgi:hypothetical protein